LAKDFLGLKHNFVKIFFKFIVDIFSSWINSFNNDKGGFSARKEAAFGAWVISTIVTLKYTTPENLEGVLTLWLLYSLLCLGIITLQQVAELKSGRTEKRESTTITTETQEKSNP